VPDTPPAELAGERAPKSPGAGTGTMPPKSPGAGPRGGQVGQGGAA
jgi:ATP-dependent Clp protease ATP-binding subunit ClpC